MFSHVFLEVSFEFADTLTPVGARLFADELDVEEGALARPEELAGGLAAHDTRGHIGHDVLLKKKYTMD